MTNLVARLCLLVSALSLAAACIALWQGFRALLAPRDAGARAKSSTPAKG